MKITTTIIERGKIYRRTYADRLLVLALETADVCSSTSPNNKLWIQCLVLDKKCASQKDKIIVLKTRLEEVVNEENGHHHQQ